MPETDRTPWWISFFQGPWGALQRAGYPEERTTAETDFVARALELQKGERVLDVPCGNGRHSIELASRGFRVTGVDLNADNIASARGAAERRGLRAEFFEHDMRSFVAKERFDAAICYGGSFGYFDDEGNLEFARAVNRALHDGGRFLIHTPVAESLFPVYKARDWSWSDDSPDAFPVLEERTWDMETARIYATWTFARPHATSSLETSVRIYTCHEMYELLRQVGFRECRFLEAGTGAPFKMGSPAASVAVVTTK